MKLLPIICGVVLLSATTFAAPKPFFDTIADWTNKLGDTFSGGIKLGGDLVNDGFDLMNNMTKQGINRFTDMGVGITQGITNSMTNTLKFWDEMSKSIAERIKNSVSRITNSIITRVVEQVKERLVDVERRAQNVLIAGEQKLDDIKQKVDQNIQAVQDNLNNWSDSQINKLDDDVSIETRQKIENLLDDFVDQSTKDAKQCGNSLTEPVDKLQRETRETVEETFPIIDEVVAKIQECARMDQKNTKAVSDCAAQVKQKAEALRPLPEKYATLLKKWNRVTVSTIMKSPCVGQTVEKIQIQKMELEKQIRNIVKDSRDAMTTTESNSSPSEPEVEPTESQTTESEVEPTKPQTAEPETVEPEVQTTVQPVEDESVGSA